MKNYEISFSILIIALKVKKSIGQNTDFLKLFVIKKGYRMIVTE